MRATSDLAKTSMHLIVYISRSSTILVYQPAHVSPVCLCRSKSITRSRRPGLRVDVCFLHCGCLLVEERMLLENLRMHGSRVDNH